jgi:hypothetical protein
MHRLLVVWLHVAPVAFASCCDQLLAVAIESVISRDSSILGMTPFIEAAKNVRNTPVCEEMLHGHRFSDLSDTTSVSIRATIGRISDQEDRAKAARGIYKFLMMFLRHPFEEVSGELVPEHPRAILAEWLLSVGKSELKRVSSN